MKLDVRPLYGVRKCSLRKVPHRFLDFVQLTAGNPSLQDLQIFKYISNKKFPGETVTYYRGTSPIRKHPPP